MVEYKRIYSDIRNMHISSFISVFICFYMFIYIYIYRENAFGRPNAFADDNALSVYTVEHERY